VLAHTFLHELLFWTQNAASDTCAVGNLYACVSKFTPGMSFTLVGGVPSKPLTDHAATLASAGLLNALVRQTKS
jgi:hypothetical protein